MALKDYGKADNDPGEWVDFGLDKPFRLRIRRIPADVWDEIDRRHQNQKDTFEIKEGIRRRVKDEVGLLEALTEKALWAWTDAEGLEIEVEHDDAARVWSDLLKREVQRGETITLAGGILTATVKRRVLRHLRPIARVEPKTSDDNERQDIGSFIVLEAARLQQEFAAAREAQAKN